MEAMYSLAQAELVVDRVLELDRRGQTDVGDRGCVAADDLLAVQEEGADPRFDRPKFDLSACPSGPLETALPLGVPELEPPARGLEVRRKLVLEHPELSTELEQPVLEPAFLRADVFVAPAVRHRSAALVAGHVRRLGDRSEHRESETPHAHRHLPA